MKKRQTPGFRRDESTQDLNLLVYSSLEPRINHTVLGQSYCFQLLTITS